MKLLHVTRDFPPRVNGGISTACGGLVASLRAEGIACEVLSFDGWRPSRVKAAPAPVATDGVMRIVSPAALDGAAGFGADAAIVHVHHGMLWEHAERIAAGRPTVFTVHVAQRTLRQLRGLEAPTASELGQARALCSASVVTVPSAAVADAIERKAHVLALGVEGDEDAAVDPDPPCALYVGRFGDVKGTAELLDVGALAPCRVVIAGGLPDNPKADARWRRRFAERAPRAELAGWLEPAALRLAYRAASFIVVPSWYETFGQTVAEAMQHGVPAIASAVGGLPELVGDAGLLIPPRDGDALLAAMRTLATDAPRRHTLRQAAYRAAPSWRWSQRIGPWIEMYRSLRAHG